MKAREDILEEEIAEAILILETNSPQ